MDSKKDPESPVARKMDEEERGQESQISLTMGILGLIAAIILDLVSLIPFVGDVEGVPAAVVWLFNFIIGLSPAIQTVMGLTILLKFIPVVQEFPLWTIAWLFTWYALSHSTKFVGKVIQKSAAAAGVLEGNVSSGAKALEGAAATEVAQVAKAGESAAEAGAGAVRAEEAGVEAAESGRAAKAGEKEAAKEIEPEALGQKRDLLGEQGSLNKELFEKTPQEEFPQKTDLASDAGGGAKKRPSTRERIRDAYEKGKDFKEKLDTVLPQGNSGAGDENQEEEPLRPAA